MSRRGTSTTSGAQLKLAGKSARPDADAIFLSCGGLRSLEVVDEIEQLAGKPVIASNQA